MQDQPNDLLLVAGKVLTIILQIALVIGGLAILIAAPIMLVFNERISIALANASTEISGGTFIATTVFLMALALGIMSLAYLFLGKLRAIISSVGEGEPFAPENAERLNLMAWLMLGTQVLMIPALALGIALEGWVESSEEAEITLDAGVDIEGILIVIVLFILARVFKHGAAMREDLEGTV